MIGGVERRRVEDGAEGAGNGGRATRLLEVSAVVPAYEEAGSLDWVVERTLRALEARCARLEVILVVHAGARDGTPEMAAAWARRDARVRVVAQGAGGRGYGAALALGIEAARLPWIFLLDADGQFDPLDFPLLAGAAAGVDLVAGRRRPRADGRLRRAAGRVYNLLLRGLLGSPLRDADCAFKLFRRSLVQGGLRCRHLADGEIVARALRGGARWREVDVPHHPRRAGSSQAEALRGVPRPGLVLAVLAEMAALRRELGRRRSP
jgi:glycosyltransferase involved in cell wall biosynthesis